MTHTSDLERSNCDWRVTWRVAWHAAERVAWRVAWHAAWRVRLGVPPCASRAA